MCVDIAIWHSADAEIDCGRRGTRLNVLWYYTKFIVQGVGIAKIHLRIFYKFNIAATARSRGPGADAKHPDDYARD